MLAVLAATVAAFVLSAVWYTCFSGVLATLSDAYAQPRPMRLWQVAAEMLRSAVVATVLWLTCDRLGADDLWSAVSVAVLAWVAFPGVLLSGSVLHEQVPWRLAAVHAGDWLLKLLAVTVVVGLWG